MGLGKTLQAIAFIAAIKGGKEIKQNSLLSVWNQYAVNKSKSTVQLHDGEFSSDGITTTTCDVNNRSRDQNHDRSQTNREVYSFNSSRSKYDHNKREVVENESRGRPNFETKDTLPNKVFENKIHRKNNISRHKLFNTNSTIIDLEEDNISSSSNAPSDCEARSFQNKENPKCTSLPTSASLTQLPVLIICPASILQHWSREFLRWYRLRVFVCHGREKFTALNLAKKNQLDVMVTSYDTFRWNFKEINAIDWACMIFDEVHRIKNKASKLTQLCRRIRTRRRFGMTGTVMQNSFEELWTLIDFHCPGFLGSLDNFRRQYVNPIKNGHRHDATAAQIARGRIAAKSLAEKLKKVILRRTKSTIANELPGKEDNVVFCKLSPLQLRCYERVLKSREYELLRKKCVPCECGSGYVAGECCHKSEWDSTPDWRRLVLPAIGKLHKIANHLGLLHVKETLVTEASPKIKRALQFEQVAFGEDAPEIMKHLKEGNDIELCGKLRVLKTLLPLWKKEGAKVLLFSTSTKMMDLLAKFLRREQYTFSRIDGNTPMQNRQRLVDLFSKSKTTFIFLISTKACGLGLNLSVANIVVIFDPSWNVTLDLQAQDRAYRIGQKKYTKVFRFISAGTIEEMTYTRQIYKQQLANIGLHGCSERRYFSGVAGVKGQEGEIFGLANLFKLYTDSVLTYDIIERTAQKEQLYYKIAKYQESSLTSEKEEHRTPNCTNKEKDKNTTDRTNFTEYFDCDFLEHKIDEYDNDTTSNFEFLRNPQKTAKSVDELSLLSTQNGVLYSHRNNEVIGESVAERELTKRVLETEPGSGLTDNFLLSPPFMTPLNTDKRRRDDTFRISFVNLKENTQRIPKNSKKKKKICFDSEEDSTSDENTSS
jgi:superfamily II DNA/RNA helicase